MSQLFVAYHFDGAEASSACASREVSSFSNMVIDAPTLWDLEETTYVEFLTDKAHDHCMEKYGLSGCSITIINWKLIE